MKKVALAAALLLAFGGAQAAGDAAAGKTKAALCIACHGADGNSVNPIWPKLAGQHDEYLVKQLHDFQSGARKDPTMTGMAATLGPQDVLNVAAYFSSQTRVIGSADAAVAAAGKQLYDAGNPAKAIPACMSCHGPTGAGNPGAKFPSLSGQHATYVTKALTDFRSGARGNDMNGMMRDIAANMSDADIKAVAGYISGLH